MLSYGLFHSWLLVAAGGTTICTGRWVVVVGVHLIQELLVLPSRLPRIALLTTTRSLLPPGPKVLILHKLLLLPLQLLLDTCLRVHVLDLPLAFQELLSLPVTVELAVLLT